MSNRLIQTISLKDDGYSRNVKSAREALEKLGKENGVVNNSFRSTSKELNSAKKFYSQLTSEYNKLSDSAKKGEFGKAMHAQIEQTRKDLKQLMEDTARTKKELADMEHEANVKVNNSSSKGGGFNLGGMLGGGKALLKKAGIIGAGLSALDAVKDNINYAMDFEKAASGVKALTGAGEEAMQKYKKAAIDLGGTTTQTASQVMDAFGMIGSQAPELLKDANALTKVTENAIILSEAAGIDLADAAKGVTGILNQFGISASRSREIINLLAAASQQGAGNIEYLNTAITKCGSVAGALNINVNEVVGELEMLAQAGVDSSTAGNNLKNIMLILEQSTDRNLKPSVVGLNKALENLAKQQKSTTALSKMFGKENVASAISLIKNAEAATKMSQSIQGTNTAIEQQKINNDNLAGSLKNLESKWEAFNLSLNQSNGLLKKTIDLVADLVGWFTKLNNTPTTIGGKALSKIDEEFGSSTAYQDKTTRKEQWAAYSKRLQALQSRYNELMVQQNAYEKGMNDTKRGKAVQAQQAALYTGTKLTTDALKKEIQEFAKGAREFFYGPQKQAPTTPTTTKDEPTKTKNKSSKQIYEETMNVIEAELSNGIITVKKALEKKKSAIEQYISALSKTKAQVEKNTPLIKKLSADFKTIDAELKVIEQREKDEKTISDANEKYAKTIKQIERDRQNGFIDEKEYQTSYISAIKELIKSYSKVENLTDDLINTVKAKQKEIKDFELHQLEKTLIRNNLDRNAQVEKIYNNGRIERQAPANDAYKQKESAFNYLLGISNPVSLSGIVDLEDIWKNPGHKMTEKEERWYKEYKSFLGENKALLGDMDAEVNNIYDAMNLIRKLDLAMAFKDFVDQGKSAQEFMMRYFDNIKSVGIDLRFDKEGAIKKYNEIVNSNLPIEEKYKQVAEVERVADEAAKRMADKLSKYIFPQPFGKGDASNYSLTGNTSYFKVSESANKYNYGAGRLDENLMDDRITQKMNDDMTALLEKYKDIEDLYVKANMEAEKNSETGWLATNYSEELDGLEKQINSLHNKIQDRLTFQLKIEGAQDALGGLNDFASIGSNLASIPDTLDSIADSSNDAAAAFQYFGVIINSVQDIIDGIKVTMEIYKALQDLFTVSTQAQNLAIQDNAASQVQQAATSEANTLAKTTETVANKALEASVLDLAAAEIFAAHAYIPFAGVPIATANVGAMMGSMAGVHATSLGLTAMANGGIVGGMQFSGDATIIRANKGEMILNKEQQANLFSLLDSPSARGGGNGDVRFEIQGDKLVGVLNNHNRYHSKSGNKLKL